MGLLLHNFIKAYLFTPSTVAMTLAVGAVLMIVVERRGCTAASTSLDEMPPKSAFGIGCFQCLALWPGFPRPASTMMGGMVLGAGRRLAAGYSCIAAVPIMVAPTGCDMLMSCSLLPAADVPSIAVGFVGSFISALIALVGRVSPVPFAVYRLVPAPLVWYFMVCRA